MHETSLPNIENNVADFLDIAAKTYASIKKDSFSQLVYCELLEKGFKSPIERIFYIALRLQCKELMIELNPDPEYDKETGMVFSNDGVYVTEQRKIGKYKVDFYITHQFKSEENSVVVELDGHMFHDRNKQQRSYEKARDRFLLKNGHKVFHFTGSDVVRSPYKVVFEVLQSIGLYQGFDSLEDYDPNNAMGWR